MRHHSKTRTGCKTCRRRKIKCDEETPICNNCTKRKIECIWEGSNDNHPASSPVEPLPVAPYPQGTPSTSSLPPSEGDDMLDVLGLELIHHYTNSTCFTFCRDEARTEIYRSKLPALAFHEGNSFLLHAVLAISALHLYSLNPASSRYSLAASTHCAQALAGVKAVWYEEGSSSADPNAVFLTYAVLTVYGHATSTPPLCHETSKDWLSVLRTLVSFGQKWPLDRDISEAFQRALLPQNIDEPINPAVRFPDSLTVLPLPLPGSPDIAEVQNPVVSAVYQECVALLRLVWKASFHPHYQSYALMSWFGRVPMAFFGFLFERRPRALLLMAHFYVISKRVEQTWWSKKDWDQIILNLTNEIGVKWEEFMDWDTGYRSPAVRDDHLSFPWLTNYNL
ncbi:uncharacterized protein EV420DRAFT_125555 [Desarmillaria tabescens]|uniref:Zn(2)-C6 fungal-type domain-containing protein n=1 Tax=Armillaria tabescens TaxID=1929756 RepID=A0AA39N9X5_ARMTA|nr:uncharacterized protein EV420DRAFT_125555 [Desarmillaria tabescens]KAK0461737.1 hypothetical protein EV420DRAFT_125555 [Desarmillaria tabescens]